MQANAWFSVLLLASAVLPAVSSAAETVTPAQEALFRETAPKFHQNFDAGAYEKNGPMVTEDIAVDSNNTQLTGRDNFVKRIARFAVPFPGIQLRDQVIIVDGNVAADAYTMQATHNGPFGDLPATGRKIEAMGAEIFEFSPQAQMKKLITVTELDRIKAEVTGSIAIDHFQTLQLLPNGKADAATHARIKQQAAALDSNFNSGKAAENALLVAPEVSINADNVALSGRQALIDYQDRLKTAFPDLRITDEYVLAEGMRAAVEFLMEGTQTGALTLADGSSLPPTGRKVRVRGFAFLRFNPAGLISDITYIQNQEDFVSQLKQ